MSEPRANICTTRHSTTAMSAPERVTEAEWHVVAQAHRQYSNAHKDFLRLALLRAQDRHRENTVEEESAASADVSGPGSTKYTKINDKIQSVRALIFYIVYITLF